MFISYLGSGKLTGLYKILYCSCTKRQNFFPFQNLAQNTEHFFERSSLFPHHAHEIFLDGKWTSPFVQSSFFTGDHFTAMHQILKCWTGLWQDYRLILNIIKMWLNQVLFWKQILKQNPLKIAFWAKLSFSYTFNAFIWKVHCKM